MMWCPPAERRGQYSRRRAVPETGAGRDAGHASVAATEYQYSMSDVNSDRAVQVRQQMTQALRQRPELPTSTTTWPIKARAQADHRSRQGQPLGVPVQTIDDTLYDSFGQRQISTIFTQLNQYRVVLEVAPQFRSSTALLNQLTVKSNGNGALTGSNATSFGQAASSNSSTSTGIASPTPASSSAPAARFRCLAGQCASHQCAAGDQSSAAAAGGDGYRSIWRLVIRCRRRSMRFTRSSSS
jgi:hypothetical protein